MIVSTSPAICGSRVQPELLKLKLVYAMPHLWLIIDHHIMLIKILVSQSIDYRNIGGEYIIYGQRVIYLSSRSPEHLSIEPSPA